jgi:hypothetical protein
MITHSLVDGRVALYSLPAMNCTQPYSYSSSSYSSSYSYVHSSTTDESICPNGDGTELIEPPLEPPQLSSTRVNLSLSLSLSLSHCISSSAGDTHPPICGFLRGILAIPPPPCDPSGRGIGTEAARAGRPSPPKLSVVVFVFDECEECGEP